MPEVAVRPNLMTETEDDFQSINEDVCSVCFKSSKVTIEDYQGKPKQYGPYYDDDGERVACIYCAADELTDSFYGNDYAFSSYADNEYIRELFESGILYMAAKKRKEK